MGQSADLPAGRAKPLRLMSENFTLYRGESGAAQVLAPYCAHRGTSLSTGWVEGDSLRCFYHGWKYGAGRPLRRGAGGTRRLCRHGQHPLLSDARISRPDLRLSRRGRRAGFPDAIAISKTRACARSASYRRDCNYFNNLENQCDPVHVAFAHRTSAFTEGGLIGVPQVSAEETDWGLALRATRALASACGSPNSACPTSSTSSRRRAADGADWSDMFAWRVPIDDLMPQQLQHPSPSPHGRSGRTLSARQAEQAWRSSPGAGIGRRRSVAARFQIEE